MRSFFKAATSPSLDRRGRLSAGAQYTIPMTMAAPSAGPANHPPYQPGQPWLQPVLWPIHIRGQYDHSEYGYYDPDYDCPDDYYDCRFIMATSFTAACTTAFYYRDFGGAGSLGNGGVYGDFAAAVSTGAEARLYRNRERLASRRQLGRRNFGLPQAYQPRQNFGSSFPAAATESRRLWRRPSNFSSRPCSAPYRRPQLEPAARRNAGGNFGGCPADPAVMARPAGVAAAPKTVSFQRRRNGGGRGDQAAAAAPTTDERR
jgi:hypothetical protein